MAGLNDWSKTAADNATKGDINFAEGQRPSSLNDSNRVAMADTAKQRDDISGAVETTGAAGVYAMTPNATATNQTTGLMVRVQINHDSPSGGCTFNYGAKGAKAIKVIDSAGERDPNANELKQNAFCTMTYDADADSSAGAWIATDIVTAALDTSNFSLKVEAEGTKASAATCDIGSVTEYRVKVTGTTTITSFGSVVNSRKLVRFTAALTLTHHATSLILPGGANITTAAGDVAEFASNGSGNWRCTNYEKANGKAIVSTDTTTIEADITELDRVAKNWVVNHITTTAQYAAAADMEALVLETTINNVAADNAVEISAMINFEAGHGNVWYIERNGTEILSSPAAGSRKCGIAPVIYDAGETTTTMVPTPIMAVDESPDTGTNTYTFHMRGLGSSALAINRTNSDTDVSSRERAASSVILKELAK
jgi:hypothetical protein